MDKVIEFVLQGYKFKIFFIDDIIHMKIIRYDHMNNSSNVIITKWLGGFQLKDKEFTHKIFYGVICSEYFIPSNIFSITRQNKEKLTITIDASITGTITDINVTSL